jgi:uncharacterized protein YukE
VDYQLLASITRTLEGLASEFAHLDDQVASFDSAYGSDAIASAMSSFSGNWSNHRKTLLSTMENLGKMTAATEQHFRQADNQLASDLTRK